MAAETAGSLARTPARRALTLAHLDADALSAADVAQVLHYAEAASAANTRVAYDADWRAFVAWCAERDAERLSALVERDGWQQAASQVSADPTILGQLAGRDGFLAGARSRGDRLAALKSIDSAITWTGRLPQLTERAIERRQQDKAYSERAEQAYAERDAVKDASSDRQYQRAAAQERERRQDRGQGMER